MRVLTTSTSSQTRRNPWRFGGWLLLALALLSGQVSFALAQQAPPAKEEDLLSGFDTPSAGTETASPDVVPEQNTPRWLHVAGFLRMDSAYNYAHQPPRTGETDWRGLSKLR
ncbi:MAG: hypothetical protein OEW39_04165, partial [Deltaproteobacteria bacterium]|nr:hypothetical protein [Deltaproteobacteria bacterium]